MSAPSGAAPSLPARLAVVVAVGAVALGVWLRIEQVRWPLLFGDEFHSLRLVGQGYGAILSTFDAFGSGLGLPLLQRLALDALGAGHFGLRAIGLIGGLLALLATGRLGTSLASGAVGLGAAVLVALSSFHVYYSGFGRSYALVSAVVVLYVGAVTRLALAERPGRRTALAVLVSAGLLPWLHLTALAVVIPVALAVGVDLLSRGRRAALLSLVLAHLGAALLVAGVHLPAWDGLQAFVGDKGRTELGAPFGSLDVATLMAGGRPAALVALVALVAGALGLVGARARGSLPLLAGCFGPCLVLAVVQPYGGPYAYARYLVAVVPLAALVIAWGLSTLLRRVALAGPSATLAPCLLLGVASYLTGPLAPTSDAPARFGATYLGLLPLAPFDAPWPAGPPLYARLADDADVARIVEVPYLKKRTQHLYRNYALQHGKDVVLGLLPDEGPLLPDGPYVRLLEPGWREAAGAELLVVHLDVLREVQSYWAFVAARYRKQGADPTIEAFMKRHRQYGQQVQPVEQELLSALTAELGEPLERDEHLVVWRL